MSFGDSRVLPVRKIIQVVPVDGDDPVSPVTIAAGAFSNFSLTTCLDGDRIPNRINIQGIRIFPFTMIGGNYSAVSTIWRTRLFANSLRYFAEYDANWFDFTEASSDPSLDETNILWVCQIAGSSPDGVPGENTIYGRIDVKAGENPSAFRVVILFR